MIKIGDSSPIKEGDWVQIVKLVSGHNGIIGAVFQVDEISDGGYYYCTSETHVIGGAWKLEEIQKVTGPFVDVIPSTILHYINLIVVKDIIRKDIVTKGTIPPIIPKGTKLWCDANPFAESFDEAVIEKFKNPILPFNNYWCANIPNEYFELDTSVEQPLRNHLNYKIKKKQTTKIKDVPPKFSIGEKVKVVSETQGWGDVSKEDIGVIVSFKKEHDNSYSYWVDFLEQSSWHGAESCFISVETFTTTNTYDPISFEQVLPKQTTSFHLIKKSKVKLIDTFVPKTNITIPNLKKNKLKKV